MKNHSVFLLGFMLGLIALALGVPTQNMSALGLLSSTATRTRTPTKVPTPTRTPTPTKVVADDDFNLSTANQVKPDDIIEEVEYYGGAGPGDESINSCASPQITIDPNKLKHQELMILNTMTACGWKKDETVKGIIQYPDGRSIVVTIKLFIMDGAYYGRLGFKPAITDPAGTYKYKMEGKSGTVELKVIFRKPNGPRLFRIDDSNLMLYGFKSKEKVRLIYYDNINDAYNGYFKAWKAYQVNSSGSLTIKTTADKAGAFVILGESSGEVRLLYEDETGNSVDRIPFYKSILKDVSCGSLTSRLSRNGSGRVAYTDGSDMRLRETPGLSQSVVAKIPEGTQFTIKDGPICVDRITWWKIKSKKGNGWAAEYKDTTYFLEPWP